MGKKDDRQNTAEAAHSRSRHEDHYEKTDLVNVLRVVTEARYQSVTSWWIFLAKEL